MTELNTQIELIVSEIIGATRKASALEDLAQANVNGIKDITKLVKNIAVTHCCKSDSELFTPNDVKLPKENKPISMHTDSNKTITKKV